MSSLKMTFSLTSLIFLIALGLVFAPMSVMAHEVAGSNNGTGQVHAGDTAGDTNHGAHPTVTSITLKKGEKVRDNMVVVTDPSATGGVAADAQFTLVITFDEEVVSAANIRSAAVDVVDPTADPVVDNVVLTGASDFAETVTLGNNAPSTGEVTFADATRVEGSNNKFEAVGTLATAFPTGASGDKAFTLRVNVNARAAFSPQTHPKTSLNPIPGGPSEPSTVYAFTLVKALPTLTTLTGASEVQDDGTIDVTFTASAAVTDVDITHSAGTGLADSYTVSEIDDGAPNKYMVTVTLKDATAAMNYPAGDITFTATAMSGSMEVEGMYDLSLEARTYKAPPAFDAGAEIDDIIIWEETPFTTPVLPKATAIEGTDFRYKVRAVPATGSNAKGSGSPSAAHNGFELRANDVQDRTLRTMSSAVMKATKYEYIAYDTSDPMVESAPLNFSITVLAKKKPTAPTMVTAMEEGWVATPRTRMVNTNKVEVTWVAPVDTTETSHDPAIPFGAPIMGYKVTRVDKADSSSVTYPRANDDAIKKDAVMYLTPDVLDLGTYGFKVLAFNSVGDGAYNDPAVDALVANPPAHPEDLDHAIDEDEPDAATLTWVNRGSDGGAPIIGHTIKHIINDIPEEDIDVDSVDVEYKVEDLVPGKHAFRVAAVNSDGQGTDSNTAKFSVAVPTDPTDPVNVKPTFGNATITNITATVGTAINGVTLPAATDPDGDDGDITYALDVSNIGLDFDPANRFLSGKPDEATDGAAIYTYTATDADGGSASLKFTITVNTVPTVTPPVSPDLDADYDPMTGVTTIGTSAEAGTMIASNGFATIGSGDLPDLEEFFDIGGTITLSNGDATDDKNSRTVVISEILWGLDLGAPAMDQTKWQFIELYNTTGAAIDLDGWTLTFKGGNILDAIDIDQVSNRGRTGWDVDSGDTGKSGRVTGTLATDVTSAITPVNIVSMYRNIDYAGVKAQVANRGELVKKIPGGNAKGSWKSSQRRSTYNRWIYDSKRAEHFKSQPILSASSVSGTPFRINEIGNDDGSANDWIELHNVTDAVASLKNYQLSVVTAKGTDKQLFHFHDQDWKVGAKGYVVISTRHPRDTDLAAGKDISVADDQEENKGASHLFVVKSVDLPDDGKFAIILRNNHEGKHLGTGNQLVDVVATSQGAFGDNDRATSLWPLTATGGPHGNVIDGGDEVFKSGLVYQRNGGNGRGEKQFAVRGFTGIGYDRAAEDTGSNGGTPGYDNGAIKEKIADLSNAEVTFSEIMLSLGEGRQNLPQWIEIYNSSMTQAVNLNGWKLHVENYSDVETALDAVLTLGNMEISPNQTVLIVTNTGRVSDPEHFPSNRVLNLWTTKAHRDALEMIRRTDQVFSTQGFNLQLFDKDNKLVDEAGNLDGNRRTRDELEDTWTIPMNGDDERRSSLIRVYDAGVAINGTMAEAWVLADETNLAYAISETYYGDPDDYGTPGFRGGGPLPVSLSKFRPERSKDTGEIVVRWTTESELSNAGFNILRSEKRDGEFTKVHFEAGQGTTSERTTYEWKDTSAKPNVVYYYQIQDVSLDGEVQTLRQSRLKGNVTVAGKATTTWGEIKALQ